MEEIRARAERSERVLVTTLTKRMAEDLSQYYLQMGLRVRYLHSDVDTLERVEVIRDLRLGKFDVLIGINLLREGLDIPEVSLVAVLDADKEGFLRAERSLIQTIGRASRHINGKAILYADHMTESMNRAIGETTRRRELQMAYNQEHGITPRTVITAIKNFIEEEIAAHQLAQEAAGQVEQDYVTAEFLEELQAEMLAAAQELNFERAAELRDRIAKLKGEAVASPQVKKRKGRRRR